jgi:hypothetical protein
LTVGRGTHTLVYSPQTNEEFAILKDATYAALSHGQTTLVILHTEESIPEPGTTPSDDPFRVRRPRR